jgi:hypothetical protein
MRRRTRTAVVGCGPDGFEDAHHHSGVDVLNQDRSDDRIGVSLERLYPLVGVFRVLPTGTVQRDVLQCGLADGDDLNWSIRCAARVARRCASGSMPSRSFACSFCASTRASASPRVATVPSPVFRLRPPNVYRNSQSAYRVDVQPKAGSIGVAARSGDRPDLGGVQSVNVSAHLEAYSAVHHEPRMYRNSMDGDAARISMNLLAHSDLSDAFGAFWTWFLRKRHPIGHH